MITIPKKLQDKLDYRKTNNALRLLKPQSKLIDFSSNDYLGFSNNQSIYHNAYSFLKHKKSIKNGATGSRLLSGNHSLYTYIEDNIAQLYQTESALIFNSGYTANIGFFSSVPQRGDIILYDEYIHASIRDGIFMSHAKSYKFKHNDVKALEKKYALIHAQNPKETNFYIVTESVFSMDGDTPNLKKIAYLCQKYNAFLVVDEAHATGVIGNNGVGLVQHLHLENFVFARIITFGKALGCHGAAILGSSTLKNYLINFSRSLIYTTALPPHNLATIYAAYQELTHSTAIKTLFNNIITFKTEIAKHKLEQRFIASNSAIQSCIIPGNNIVKSISEHLERCGFNVKPILSPTVPSGEERLRFCLHSYNTKSEILDVLKTLSLYLTHE